MEFYYTEFTSHRGSLPARQPLKVTKRLLNLHMNKTFLADYLKLDRQLGCLIESCELKKYCYKVLKRKPPQDN